MVSWDSREGAARAGQARPMDVLQAREGITGQMTLRCLVLLPTPDLLPPPEAVSAGAV